MHVVLSASGSVGGGEVSKIQGPHRRGRPDQSGGRIGSRDFPKHAQCSHGAEQDAEPEHIPQAVQQLEGRVISDVGVEVSSVLGREIDCLYVGKEGDSAERPIVRVNHGQDAPES
jgi:hypothetical protein